MAAAAQNKYYSTIWRTSLGIGTVFPLVLFVLRLKLKEPEEFSRNSMKYARTPYALVLRFYGWRLFVVSLIWFIYDVRQLATPFSTSPLPYPRSPLPYIPTYRARARTHTHIRDLQSSSKAKPMAISFLAPPPN